MKIARRQLRLIIESMLKEEAREGSNPMGKYFSDDAVLIKQRESAKIDATSGGGGIRLASGGYTPPGEMGQQSFIQEINLEIDIGKEWDPARTIVIESNVPFAIEGSGGPSKNVAAPLNPSSPTSEYGLTLSMYGTAAPAMPELSNYPDHARLPAVQEYSHRGTMIRKNIFMERSEGTQRITIRSF